MKNSEVNKIFAENLRKLREQRGLSLRELGENIGISYQALNFYENCKREPSLRVVKNIADYFGVSIDFMIGD